MKSFSSVLFIVLFFQVIVYGQISQDRALMSESVLDREDVGYIQLPSVDVDKALEEDAIEASKKDLAQRFGIPITTNLDFFMECTSTILSNGNYIHRLAFAAPGAKSLNLSFSSFFMVENSWMHIYSPDKKEILGAFTHQNNKESGLFATVPLFNDSLIIEVYGPASFKEGIVIDNIVYGYRNWKSGPEQFGSSGSCNINVACPEGNGYRDQIKSVVLLLTGANNRLCSGAMINNVEEDGTPYLLTANHCPVGSNNIVVFNYESPICTPSKDTSLSQSINGISILARNGKSDFVLARLSSTPPSNYNFIYSGWDNTGAIPSSTVGIHHPSGDVKKISFDNKAAISSGYYSSGNDHWMIEYWDKGTTEVISSGSPLFNQQKRIIGQLHGGDALCSAPNEEDYYGKFSLSWNLQSDSSKQLKYWLDPQDRGATVMTTLDPNQSSIENDPALLGFINFNPQVCSSNEIIPEVLIKNRGQKSVSNPVIKYYLNNILVRTDNTTASIAPDDFFVHTPAKITVDDGSYTLKAYIQNADDDYSNNTAEIEISVVNNAIPVELTLQTDNDGNETSWELMSASNTLLESGGGYPSLPGGQLIKDTFCLYNGCFIFNIYDEYGDGICCDFGNGYYVLRNLNTGDTLVKSFDFKGADSTHSFCLGDSCGIRSRIQIQNASVTNSEDGSLFAQIISGNPPFSFKWSTGDTTQGIDSLNSGEYWVRIEDSLGCVDTIYAGISIGTSIRERKNLLGSVNIYPNPTKGQVVIEHLPVELNTAISVLDLRGRLLFTSNSNYQEQVELDLSHLNNGMYLIEFLEKENFGVYRVVVNK